MLCCYGNVYQLHVRDYVVVVVVVVVVIETLYRGYIMLGTACIIKYT